MARKTTSEKRREISTQWYARPADMRTREHVEEFADDVHRQGLRLMDNSTSNVQAVRDLLRMHGRGA